MYKLFNIHTRMTNENKFLSYDAAADEAIIWSFRNKGTVIIIEEETGYVVSIWDKGEESYSRY